MVNAANGVTLTKFVNSDGTVIGLKTREANENSESVFYTNENGIEVAYNKVKVKNKDGKEEYKYIHFEKGKELTPETGKKDISELPTFMSLDETKWDRGVDAVTDGILGIDNTKPVKDGKDDGTIGFTEGCKHFFKGIISPFKAMIKHPIKTLIGVALTAAACAAAPVVGTVLAVGGLAFGLYTGIKGIINLKNAKTDAEARIACEDMGTGTITSIMSAIGIRKMYKGAQAKTESFKESTHYNKDLPDTTTEHHGIIAKITHPSDTFQALKTGKLHRPQGNDCKLPEISDKSIPGNKADGPGKIWGYLKEGKSINANADITTVRDLSNQALAHIHNGHHWQAKTAISKMQTILKAGKLPKENIEEAQKAIASATKLLDATKTLNTNFGLATCKIPVLGKLPLVPEMPITPTTTLAHYENIANSDLKASQEFMKNVYTVATES